MIFPSRDEFEKGCQQYEIHEPREAMYKVATFLVSHYWGKPDDMADGLGVLLLTWNQAFYRYGSFNFYSLETCIKDTLGDIEKFRDRDILSLAGSDYESIKKLFLLYHEALQSYDKNNKGRKSPVAVSKALHLLAPKFFPLWDKRIAEAYDCNYQYNPAAKYLKFCQISQQTANHIKKFVVSEKTLTKLIDQYNYSKYTKGWI